MKKLRTVVLLLVFISPAVLANAEQTLRTKLQAISQFSADFSQTVVSPDGKVIHQAYGHLVIAKPGKLHWQVMRPNHDEIISNGQTIWYYSPIVEQVSIYNTSDAIVHTPFILLADQRPSTWVGYKVSATKQKYTVTSTHDSQQPAFTVQFDSKDHINEFDVIDNQGQRSEFKLSHFNAKPNIAAGEFSFAIPSGTEIDDQRQPHE
ncbi:outer membrane lipoprotein chaperone LolA [Celerinatantimonas yamalensis]|uniref:Outer-membrane lipoprotein carrier protein n=1 Tax=Celerinatantimonas yamalensis TaxID=559956 RepID=A0ABW9G361_9GAMM